MIKSLHILFVFSLLSFYGKFSAQTATIYAENTALGTGYVRSNGVKTDGNMLVSTSTTYGRGWAKFDLSSIPSNAVVTGVSIHFYTFGTSTSSSLNYITGFIEDPSTIAGTVLYNTIVNSQLFNTSTWATPGWQSKTLDQAAWGFIENNIGNNVCFGFRRGNSTLYQIYGYNAVEKPYLLVNYSIPPPSPLSISSSATTTCKNSPITLSVNGAVGETYWFEGECNTTNSIGSGTTITVYPQDTMRYFARNFDNGIWSETCADIAINVLPPPIFEGDNVICIGEVANISVSGTYDSFVWNNGSNQNTISVSPNMTTTYSLNAYNIEYDCTTNEQITIQVNPLPIVVAGEDINLCADFQDFQISTAAPAGGFWTGEGVTSFGLFNQHEYGIYPLIYSYTSQSGCLNSDTLNVSVYGNPITNFTYPYYTFCIDGSNPIPILTGDAGGVFTCNCTINEETGEIDLSSSGFGNFEVQYLPYLNCIEPVIKTISIVSTPQSIFSYDEILCKNHNSFPVLNSNSTIGLFTSIPTLTSLNPSTGEINLTIENAGTYTITNTILSDGSCISSEFSRTIQIIDLPSIQIFTTDSTLCVGDILNLIGTGGTIYNWGDGLGSNIELNLIPITNTTYTLQGFDINGCVNYDTLFVDVNNYPILNTTANQSICIGDSVLLSVSGANIIEWDNGLVNVSQQFVMPQVTTQYTVIGKDENYCADTNTVLITVNEIDDPTFSYSKNLFCLGETSPLPTISGTLNGIFYGDLSINNTTGEISLIDSGTGDFEIIYQTMGFCSRRDTFEIEIVSSFETQFSLESSICQIGNISPTIGINSHLGLFTASPTGLDINPLTGEINLETSQSGIYTVTNRIEGVGSCLSSEFSSEIELKPIPNLIVNFSDSSICLGQQVELNATGAQTYGWNNGLGVGNSKLVSPTTNTEYVVVGTGLNGCQKYDTIRMTVNLLPEINAGNDFSACFNELIVLNGSEGIYYEWDQGVQDGIGFTIQNTSNFTVIGTDVNGCQNTDNVFVQVNPLPNVFAGNDMSICSNQNLALSGSGAQSYTWSDGVIDGQPFFPINSMLYTVTGFDINGCQNTDQILVTVNPLPSIQAGNDTTICQNELITLNGSGGVNYTWNNGVNNGQAFTPNTSSSYTVIGTDINGCQNTDELIINVTSLPTVNAGNDFTVCENSIISLSGNGAISYTWSQGILDGVDFEIQNTTNFTVIGTDINGCQNTDEVMVYVNPLPTVFAGSDTSICEGDVYLLNAQGASSYLWNSTFLNQTEVSLLTGDHVFNVVGTDSFGCQNEDELLITVHPSTYSTLNVSSLGSFVLNGVEYFETGTYEQTVLNSNGCDSLITLNLIVEHLGVSSNFISTIKISPNPSESGIFNISNIENKHVSIEIYNTIGNLVQKQDVTGNTINLSEVADGVYYLKVYLNGILSENIKLLKGL